MSEDFAETARDFLKYAAAHDYWEPVTVEELGVSRRDGGGVRQSISMTMSRGARMVFNELSIVDLAKISRDYSKIYAAWLSVGYVTQGLQDEMTSKVDAGREVLNLAAHKMSSELSLASKERHSGGSANLWGRAVSVDASDEGGAQANDIGGVRGLGVQGFKFNS